MKHFMIFNLLLAALFFTTFALADTQGKEKTREKNAIENILELPFETTESVALSVFNLGTIAVTPTRTAESTESLGSAVSVFTEKELDARGIYTVKEALRKDFSADVVQSGSGGGQASLFLRGANSNHTRVMIDGVRVFDPTSPNGAYDLAHLSVDNVHQIEVIKGPQSSLYGSDAIGGVVNVITNKGVGKPHAKVFSEGGSFYTFREGAELAGQLDRFHFSLSGSRSDSDGISSAQAKLNNPEKDAYDNQTYSTRIDYDLTDSLEISTIGRVTYANYEYDDEFGVLDDPNLKAWSQQVLASVVINYYGIENTSQKLQLSLTQNHRRDFDENDGSHPNDYLRDWYYGDTQQADWTGSYRLFDTNTFVAGINYLKERGEYYRYSIFGPAATDVSESVFPKRYAETVGYFLEYRFNLNDRLSTTLNYRIENHSTAGTSDTYKIDGLYRFSQIDTAIKASTGTGFKAPTLYQLYAVPFPAEFGFGGFGGGNTQLKPEESETYEMGIEQPLADGRLNVGVTYFHNDFTNLIDSVLNPDNFYSDQYKNVSSAQSEGIEVPLSFRFSDILQMKGNYTWLNTENGDTKKPLLRRANNKANLDLDIILTKKLKMNVDTSYVGHRFSAASVKLKRYSKTNLRLTYQVNPNWDVYLRIENLFNKKYEEVRNYGTPGFSAYTGLEIRF
ncbi:MAG: hypothetical protein A3J52_01730 [Omnitrophica bacterium RIFCSPHIGHO2_02_FULL_49_9]|nr:MAG: hypothetical protein A3J52_01730 [Omnitrophica bacterium RIFCSPHIGHO2_02_FULL_49_9]